MIVLPERAGKLCRLACITKNESLVFANKTLVYTSKALILENETFVPRLRGKYADFCVRRRRVCTVHPQ